MENTLKQLIIFQHALHSGFFIFFWHPSQSKLALYNPRMLILACETTGDIARQNIMLLSIIKENAQPNQPKIIQIALFYIQQQSWKYRIVLSQSIMYSLTYKLLTFGILLSLAYSTPVVVNGGEVTINGTITQTQIDITVTYTANVQWLAIIFSKDEVNTDLHLLIKDTSDASRPVKVKDCYLDQNSHITYDDVSNIMPSVTDFWGDITYGMKMAYNRDLNTNDLQDKRFYRNEVIQVCFMSSGTAFVGGGFQTGNQKICSFFSLHTGVKDTQDRLLGNFAATSLFGGSNLTVYATQSTDQGTFQSWLFLGLVHKQQGLAPFSGRWIGVTYQDQLANTDLSVVQYGYRNFLSEIHIMDMYITNSSYATEDLNYVINQGGTDVFESLGGAITGGYTVALYKRKFRTGDNNRDLNVTGGVNTFCFILGKTWAYTNFTYDDRICLSLTVNTSYYSNFRVSGSTTDETIDYVEPPNSVVVIKWAQSISIAFILMFGLLFI